MHLHPNAGELTALAAGTLRFGGDAEQLAVAFGGGLDADGAGFFVVAVEEEGLPEPALRVIGLYEVDGFATLSIAVGNVGTEMGSTASMTSW